MIKYLHTTTPMEESRYGGADLQSTIDRKAAEGWKLHSVFFNPSSTYQVHVIFYREEIPELLRKLHEIQEERGLYSARMRKEREAAWLAMPRLKRLALFWRRPKN